MDRAQPALPGAKSPRCVIVTSSYHVFRAAIIARDAGIRGQVTGSRTAGYFWPSAMLRVADRGLREGMLRQLSQDGIPQTS